MDIDKELERIKEARSDGKTIGLVQGSWDLFHIGHLKYLIKAKASCDFLVVAMDSDAKIKKRKGYSRPIIPEEERYEFISLLNLADSIIIKPINEPKWSLIKAIEPDVLVAIKENYKDDELVELKNYCKSIKILPRQSETSTSAKIRKIIIANRAEQMKDFNKELEKSIEEFKKRINYNENMPDEIKLLVQNLADSTDWVCPVSACCYHEGNWYYGANHTDFNIPKYDIDNRTELYYSSVEHAEVNMLKKINNAKYIDGPVYTTLFPCDKCMKLLISKGIKEIYYLEDHVDKNWSKRSHELAKKHGVKTYCLTRSVEKTNVNYDDYKYIYPPNARHQEQLDIMLDDEANNIDPLDPNYVKQDILFKANYWYVSLNKFPYDGVDKQFLIASLDPIYKMESVSPEMWIELENICLSIAQKYNLPGGALCYRFGDPAYSGSSLKRVHAHVIVPRENEKIKFTIGGKKELKEGLVLERKKNNE